MIKKTYKSLQGYFSKRDGLVTIEWVGITSIVAMAAIIITAFIMIGARDLGDAVTDRMDAATVEISPDEGA